GPRDRPVANSPLGSGGAPPPWTMLLSHFSHLSGERHAQPRGRGHSRRFGSIPALRTVPRRASPALLRLPWRKRDVTDSRNSLARRADGLLYDRGTPHVPRQATRHRTDERDDQGTERRRLAKGR